MFRTASKTATVWTYWETVPGRTKPAHIELCHRAMRLNHGDGVELRVLRPDDIEGLELDLHPGWRALEEPAHRADYLRVALLAKFGGLWLDSDVITLRPYSTVLRLLDEHDFVGWEYRSGTSGTDVTYRVSMGALAARPNLELMTTWLDEIHQFFESGRAANRSTWHSLGRHIMNPLLRELVESKRMTYFPIHAETSTLPIKAKQRAAFFETGPISSLVTDDPLQTHISYFNSWMPELQTRTEDELLSGESVIEKLFQYALLPDRREELLAERTALIDEVGEIPTPLIDDAPTPLVEHPCDDAVPATPVDALPTAVTAEQVSTPTPPTAGDRVLTRARRLLASIRRLVRL